MQQNQQDISNLELAGLINQAFSEQEKRMATKDDLVKLEAKMVTKDFLTKKLEETKQALRTELVTKDYLDEKLGGLHSALVVKMRAEDQKILQKLQPQAAI